MGKYTEFIFGLITGFISGLMVGIALSLILSSPANATVYWQDTFTDTASTALASHTPDVGTSYLDPNSKFVISATNTLTKNGGEDYASNFNSTVSAYTAEIDIYMNSTVAYDAGVMFRWVNSTDYFRIQLHSSVSGTIRLYEEATERASDTSWNSGVGWFTIKIANTADNIKVYIDDVLYIDYDTTNNNTATKLGFFNWSGCAPQWDNLTVSTEDTTTTNVGAFNFGLGSKDDRLIRIQSK